MVQDFSFEFYELGRTVNDFANVDRPDVSSGGVANSNTGGLTSGDTITIPDTVELKRLTVSDNDENFEEVFNVSGRDLSGGEGFDRQLLSGDEIVSIRGLDENGDPEDQTYDPNAGLGVVFDNDYFFTATAVLPDGTFIDDVQVSFIRIDPTPPAVGSTGPHDGQIVGFFTRPFLEPGSTLTLIAGTDGGVTVPYSSIPCFVSGSLIDTDQGPQLVEALMPGDRVQTRDNGMQTVQWVGARQVIAAGRLAPVCIKRGVLGVNRDLFVSQQHRMLLQGWRAEAMFGEAEVLAAAVHLTKSDGVYVDHRPRMVTYHHLLFDQHEVIFAEGAATESLYAGDVALRGFGAAAFAELTTLFPEVNAGSSPSARQILKSYEARACQSAFA